MAVRRPRTEPAIIDRIQQHRNPRKPAPWRPAGDWAALRILEPVKDYKARHNSILLPFEAVEKAFKNKQK